MKSSMGSFKLCSNEMPNGYTTAKLPATANRELSWIALDNLSKTSSITPPKSTKHSIKHVIRCFWCNESTAFCDRFSHSFLCTLFKECIILFCKMPSNWKNPFCHGPKGSLKPEVMRTSAWAMTATNNALKFSLFASIHFFSFLMAVI